jgi:hypothetical protein
MGVQDDVWFFWRDMGVIIGWICGLVYMMCNCGIPRMQYWLWLFLLLAAALVWELELLALLIWSVLFCLDIHPFRPKDPYAQIPTRDTAPLTAAPATENVAAVRIEIPPPNPPPTPSMRKNM